MATNKKERAKMYRALIRAGWPSRAANHYARHWCLPKDYEWVDDLTWWRKTYFNNILHQIIYIHVETKQWECLQFTATQWENLKFDYYYD